VDEAVEYGVGDGGIGDDLVPVLDRHLAGDDGRTALVAIVDHLEEIAPLIAGKRSEPPIVEDEEIDTRQRLEQASIAPVAARRLDGDVRVPAKSTIHAVLDRHGLVKRGGGPRHRARGTPLSEGAAPNELWCADYKGEFMLADRRYCYPLTITDFASRYVFACEALSTTKEAYAFSVFKAVFKQFGLPNAIRTDNGVPFASPNSLFNLSKLSVWWLRLGIEIERIKPGNPQQNGRHERMHLTLKLETTKPAGKNFLQQQTKFDDFIDCYNNERPHQALNMRCPAERYVPSTRPYTGLSELDYPFHDKTVTVTACGRICFNRQKINLSTVFAGQSVGIKQVSEHIWLVTFMDYDLGYFDHETCRLEPLENPFGPKVLPMSPE
jgi:putative transposase